MKQKIAFHFNPPLRPPGCSRWPNGAEATTEEGGVCETILKFIVFPSKLMAYIYTQAAIPRDCLSSPLTVVVYCNAILRYTLKLIIIFLGSLFRSSCRPSCCSICGLIVLRFFKCGPATDVDPPPAAPTTCQQGESGGCGARHRRYITVSECVFHV